MTSGWLAAASVGPITAIVIVFVLAAVVAFFVWAIPKQNGQFPEGFDRTGWNPEQGHAGWFPTKFTWLSGGRG